MGFDFKLTLEVGLDAGLGVGGLVAVGHLLVIVLLHRPEILMMLFIFINLLRHLLGSGLVLFLRGVFFGGNIVNGDVGRPLRNGAAGGAVHRLGSLFG